MVSRTNKFDVISSRMKYERHRCIYQTVNDRKACADPENFLKGGGGGGGVKIPRRSLTENFNMAKINNLTIPGGGGGGGGPDTLYPPLDPSIVKVPYAPAVPNACMVRSWDNIFSLLMHCGKCYDVGTNITNFQILLSVPSVMKENQNLATSIYIFIIICVLKATIRIRNYQIL